MVEKRVGGVVEVGWLVVTACAQVGMVVWADCSCFLFIFFFQGGVLAYSCGEIQVFWLNHGVLE